MDGRPYAQLPLEPLTARPMRSASGGTMYLYESPQGPPGRFQKILQHGKKNEGVRSWMGGPTLSYPSTTPFRSRKTKLELALRFLRRVK